MVCCASIIRSLTSIFEWPICNLICREQDKKKKRKHFVPAIPSISCNQLNQCLLGKNNGTKNLRSHRNCFTFALTHTHSVVIRIDERDAGDERNEISNNTDILREHRNKQSDALVASLCFQNKQSVKCRRHLPNEKKQTNIYMNRKKKLYLADDKHGCYKFLQTMRPTKNQMATSGRTARTQ